MNIQTPILAIILYDITHLCILVWSSRFIFLASLCTLLLILLMNAFWVYSYFPVCNLVLTLRYSLAGHSTISCHLTIVMREPFQGVVNLMVLFCHEQINIWLQSKSLLWHNYCWEMSPLLGTHEIHFLQLRGLSFVDKGLNSSVV